MTPTTCWPRGSPLSSGGGYAIVAAQFIKRIGSLVEAVNLVGSLFYGVMLGVFVAAFFSG